MQSCWLQVEAVAKKQDETIAAQQVMQRKLESVGTDVEGAREQVAGVHASVKDLEGNLGDLSLQQQYANDGIYLLCRYACPLTVDRIFCRGLPLHTGPHLL